MYNYKKDHKKYKKLLEKYFQKIYKCLTKYYKFTNKNSANEAIIVSSHRTPRRHKMFRNLNVKNI